MVVLRQKKTRSTAIAVFKTPCSVCYQPVFCCNRYDRLLLGQWHSGPSGMDAVVSPGVSHTQNNNITIFKFHHLKCAGPCF